MDPLDRELASLLSVEPSPEFRARVRTRIAGEPSPRSWYLQWRVVACGVVAAAVVIAAVVGRVSLPGNGQRPSRLVIAQSPLPSTTLTASPVAVPSPRSARAVIHRSSPTGEPEVLVAPRDARGLRQLEALVREGRTHFVFSDEDVPAVSPAPVRDIVIAPIAIAPLEAAALSESAGNSGGDEQ
jgi:hypothetical protein